MQRLEEVTASPPLERTAILPLSMINPVRNKAHNLPRCLGGAGEVYVVDSGSIDSKVESAYSCDGT